MIYLKEYDIKENDIRHMQERYNDNIINFFKENEDFIREKLDCLISEKYLIMPIINGNIKIFLELTSELKRKLKIMKEHKYSHKMIQMILMEESLYNKI